MNAAHGRDHREFRGGLWLTAQMFERQWREQIDNLRTRLDELEARIPGDLRRVPDELGGLEDDVERLDGYVLEIRMQERMINRLEEEQARVEETLSVVSQGLMAERLRTTIITMAGVAAAMVCLAVWLLTIAPRLW